MCGSKVWIVTKREKKIKTAQTELGICELNWKTDNNKKRKKNVTFR